MGVTAEEDASVLPPSKQFFSQSDADICFINNIPHELLLYIWELSFPNDNPGDDAFTDMTRFLDYCLDVTPASEAEDERSGEEEGNQDKQDQQVVETRDQLTSQEDVETSITPTLFSILVSHVCHYWRDVAISAPSLWTNIQFEPFAGRSFNIQSMMLQRSQTYPIDIYVDCQHYKLIPGVKPPSESDMRRLFSMLIPHTHRWRIMKVAVEDYRFMHIFLSAVSSPSVSPAAQLTALKLLCDVEMEEHQNFENPDMAEHFTLFAGSAPLLTDIVLWGVHVDWNQPWIASASNLTCLHLAFHAEDVRPSWAQFTTILRSAAPSLKRLILRVSGPPGDPDTWMIDPPPGSPANSDSPIPLLQVTDFGFMFHSPPRALAILQKLSFPALRHLTLDSYRGEHDPFVRELARPASLLSTSGNLQSLVRNVESLKIIKLTCNRECIEALYGELQNLTSLDVSSWMVNTLFLDFLALPAGSTGRGGVWLPQLETLHANMMWSEIAHRVVQNRIEHGVPLSSLYLYSSGVYRLDDEELEWFEDNVKMVEVRYTGEYPLEVETDSS